MKELVNEKDELYTKLNKLEVKIYLFWNSNFKYIYNN